MFVGMRDRSTKEDIRDISTGFLQLQLGEHGSRLPVKSSDVAFLPDDRHMSAVASVSGTVRTAIEDELLASTRRLDAHRPDDLVLRYPPRPVHAILLHLHLSGAVRQKDFRIAE